MALTYESIASVTLTSPATTITFSSIPATYTDLHIVWTFMPVSASNYPGMRFNGDTSTSYGYTTLYSSSSTGSQTSYNNNIAYHLSVSSAPTTYFQNCQINIMDYTSSKYKGCLSIYSGDANGSGVVSRTYNLWRSTSVISSVSLLFSGGSNQAVGSTATLFGIKAA